MISISPLKIANFRLPHCFLASCKCAASAAADLPSFIRLDLITLIRARLRSLRPIWMLPLGVHFTPTTTVQNKISRVQQGAARPEALASNLMSHTSQK